MAEHRKWNQKIKHREASLFSLSRSARSDVLLTLYFVGMTASGLVGLFGNHEELGTLLESLLGDTVAQVYGVSIALVGVGGLMARLADSRMGEFYAIIGLSILTVLNAFALLPEHPQTALRLLFAPCMMVPYGWMRLGFTITQKQIQTVQQEAVVQLEAEDVEDIQDAVVAEDAEGER